MNRHSIYNPYWVLGELDPARRTTWAQFKEGEDRLKEIAIAPKYISFISHGELSDPQAYHEYIPNREEDDSIMIEPSRPNYRVTLFLDLGRVLPGRVEFEANPPAGVEISFDTGEALIRKQHYGATALTDGSLKIFSPDISRGGWSGMRYVWINFDNVTKPFSVTKLHGICRVRPSNYVGSFECDDELLNRIWEFCSWSVHSVIGQPDGNESGPAPILQTLLMDREDRHPWAGDSRVIQMAASYIFGEYDLLRRANESLLPVGIRPIPNLQGIPPYTLDWCLALVDYFRVSGDADYFRSRLNDIAEIMKSFDPIEGLRDGWYFFDWDSRIDRKLKEQTAGAYWGKFAHMCNEVAWAAEMLGESEVFKTFSQKSAEIKNLWKKQNEDWIEKYDIHPITNCILGNLIAEPDYQVAFNKVYEDRLQRCVGTPYFGFYVLNALAQMDKLESAIQMVRDYWGSMIEAGATTTWEEWHPSWSIPVNGQPPQYGPPDTWSGLSLCHGASAGPARWLIEHVVGISSERPGFSRIQIKPHVSDLQWAKGSAASPLGSITVSWKKSSKNFVLNFSAPIGCDGVTVFVPLAVNYYIDEKLRRPDRHEKDFAVFLLASGSHSITCGY